ncbi:hypothetical protein Ancab_030803 [Ancistrocladus abbreviatus]
MSIRDYLHWTAHLLFILNIVQTVVSVIRARISKCMYTESVMFIYHRLVLYSDSIPCTFFKICVVNHQPFSLCPMSFSGVTDIQVEWLYWPEPPLLPIKAARFNTSVERELKCRICFFLSLQKQEEKLVKF